MHIINQPLLYSYFSSYCYLRHTKDLGEIENNNGTLLQLMITVPLDDPIIYDLPIKVIKIDEFLSNYYLVIQLFSSILNRLKWQYIPKDTCHERKIQTNEGMTIKYKLSSIRSHPLSPFTKLLIQPCDASVCFKIAPIYVSVSLSVCSRIYFNKVSFFLKFYSIYFKLV